MGYVITFLLLKAILVNFVGVPTTLYPALVGIALQGTCFYILKKAKGYRWYLVEASLLIAILS
jgi:hypothetical protein